MLRKQYLYSLLLLESSQFIVVFGIPKKHFNVVLGQHVVHEDSGSSALGLKIVLILPFVVEVAPKLKFVSRVVVVQKMY